MRIKKIELIGFKSFAERTEIHLNQGVTCIVGPNGCGKSNISDALRWVFGERSAKMLRGTRMEDVIFSGTEFRKPLGMAEVSLTLDNQDHLLPIEYDEVVITRRLNRSGQSEYFINRTPCRLRDVLDLILDTGMGSNSYSMIEQGRVDSVINADPLERRFLIEEAAGISKYKVKKEEALRKLERTEQNLLRIRDIVSEVQKNIQYAEKQAKRAERYKTQFEELKKLEIQKAFLELDALFQEKKEKETRKTDLTDSQKGLEQDLDKILESERHEKEILQTILSNETAQAINFYDIRSQVQALIQQCEFNRERFQTLEHRLIEIKKEKEILNTQLLRLEKEMKSKAEECSQFDREHQEAQSLFENEKAHFEESENEFRTKKNEAEKTKTSLFEKASEVIYAKNEVNQLKNLIERIEYEQTRRAENLKKLQNEKGGFEERRLRHQEEIQSTKKVMQGGDSELEETSKALHHLNSRIQNLDLELDEKKLKRREILSRIELLSELHEASEVAENKLLSSVSGTKLHGKLIKSLRDVLQIKPGYESAVETVLGSLAQSLIAEDVETAAGLISEMASSHMGPCGIFIQSLIPTSRLMEAQLRNRETKHKPISEIVAIQQGFEPLFERLFENVYIVESFKPSLLEELLPQAHEIRFVTKEGILLGPEARIIFRNGRILPEHSPFKRLAEIEDLKKLNENLGGEIQLLNHTKQNIERETAGLEEKHASIETKGRDHLIRGEATESLLRGLEERIAVITEETQILQSEESDAQHEILLKKELLKDSVKLLSSLENEEREIQAEQQEINRELEKLQLERESRIHVFSRLKTMLENHEVRVKTIKEGELLLKNQAENTKQRLSQLVVETEDASNRIEEITAQQSGSAKELEKLTESQREAENILTTIRGRKVFQEEKHHDLLNRTRQTEEELRQIRQELHREDMKIMEFTYGEKSILDRMEQTYHVKMSEEEKIALEAADSLTSLEEQIQSLKTKVEAFGPVNLLAVDEFEELKQRHGFLVTQEKDLCEARELLLEAIRKINRTTKTLFSDTFAKAQALFQEYYQTLFGGGHAELILLPSEEDEEGVDIMVRPPGKKLQHITLLSGGEKALTAVALLFALFKIRPSPLCVLDEVDAPLDEANVDRFVSVLRAFLDNTQFLIVTHNRKTIAMGDFLYGVTMEEFGVSKIVSVKVAQAPQEKEKQVVAVA